MVSTASTQNTGVRAADRLEKSSENTRISAANPAERTTLAELGVPAGLTATAQDLWASDWAAGTVVQLVRGGQQLTKPAVVESGLKGPEGLAVAPDGSLLVVEAMAGRLSRIDLSSGKVTSVAEGLAVGAAGPPMMPPVWTLDSVAVGPSGAIYVGGDKMNELYRIAEPAALPRTGGAGDTGLPLAAIGGLAILAGIGLALRRRADARV